MALSSAAGKLKSWDSQVLRLLEPLITDTLSFAEVDERSAFHTGASIWSFVALLGIVDKFSLALQI